MWCAANRNSYDCMKSIFQSFAQAVDSILLPWCCISVQYCVLYIHPLFIYSRSIWFILISWFSSTRQRQTTPSNEKPSNRLPNSQTTEDRNQSLEGQPLFSCGNFFLKKNKSHNLTTFFTSKISNNQISKTWIGWIFFSMLFPSFPRVF